MIIMYMLLFMIQLHIIFTMKYIKCLTFLIHQWVFQPQAENMSLTSESAILTIITETVVSANIRK
jgi:hypothetical protein